MKNNRLIARPATAEASIAVLARSNSPADKERIQAIRAVMQTGLAQDRVRGIDIPYPDSREIREHTPE